MLLSYNCQTVIWSAPSGSEKLKQPQASANKQVWCVPNQRWDMDTDMWLPCTFYMSQSINLLLIPQFLKKSKNCL